MSHSHSSEYNLQMSKAGQIFKRVAFVAYLLAIHSLLIYLLFDKYVLKRALLENWEPANVGSAEIKPSPIPTPQPETTPVPMAQTPLPSSSDIRESNLLIPVQGVTRDQLIDTFADARSEGRSHDAIDIAAPLGTPVVAVADGDIVKFHDSEKGGITIYQISSTKKYFFYYAHLQRRDERIAEKQFIKKGTVIGYVGDTGNAGPGNYHLHFAISVVSDPNRFWDGVSIDPYHILRGEALLQ